LNFLRINRAAPFAFHYFEIGNEIYGSWETDQHGSAGDALPMPGGAPRLPHDPTTYISFSKQFATLALQIDPTVSIGIGSQATDSQFNNWITNILIQSNAQGFVPGYISDHVYMQGPGSENDAYLMGVSSTVVFPAPANPMNFPQRAIKYRTLVNQNLSAPVAANVELLVTEFNSVYGSPGKQITSLVNGLFLADALGSMLTTEYNGAWAWDLHNGPDTGQNNSSTLYGWRNLGDYGIIGTTGTPPATGLNVPYPNYVAEQLASKLVQSGGSVVQASSNDPLLATYAVREADGHLKLLVINKSKNGLNNDTTGTPQLLAGTFNLSGFYPASQAQVWQFGSVEDNVAKNSTNGLTALSNSMQALSLSGASSFSYSFPSLSMTVLDLTPAAPQFVLGTYPYDLAPNRVQFRFTQDVSASLSPSDLVLSNLGGGSVPAVQSVAWDGPTLTATFTLAPGIPQDGNYRATLPAASVTNALGTPLATDATFDFFVLAGDANRDRSVNLLDFNILAQNFGQSGRLFSQGDFTYDGTVDLLDFNILANKFGQSVGPGTFAMMRIGAGAKPARVIDALLGDGLA
jgi:hypothetical protein